MSKGDDLKNRLEEIFSSRPGTDSDVEIKGQSAIYQTAFERSAVGIYLTDTQGNFIEANSAFGQMLGYDIASLPGKSIQSVTYADDIHVAVEAMRSMLAGEKNSAHIQKRYLHQDGHILWVDLNITLIQDKEGRPLYFFSIVQEMTDQKRMAMLLDKRVRELNCLSDIGHKIDERPALPEFLQWVTEHIPQAMQYPDVCVSAIEYDQHIYGNAKALELENKMVGGLRIEGELIGWLHIAYTEPREFIDAESALVGAIVSRLDSYIESSQLIEEAKRRSKELTVLNELGSAMTSSILDQQAVLDNVYQYTGRLMNVADFYIALYDEAAQVISYPVALSGGEQIEIAPHQLGIGGLTDYIIQSGQPLLLSDNVLKKMEDIGVLYLSYGDDQPPVSWLGVPMVYQEHVLGVISVQTVETPGLYTNYDQEVLVAIASQAANALAASQQYEQMQQSLRETQLISAELEAVAQVSADVATILEPQELLQKVVDMTKERFNLYHAHIYLLDETNENLVITAGTGDAGSKMVDQGWSIPLDRQQSLVARTARQRQGVIVNDVRADPNFLPNELLPETASEMAVPILARDELLGVLDVQSARVNHFTQQDIAIHTTLAYQVAVALQNTRLYRSTQHALTEAEALYAGSAAIANASDMEKVLHGLVASTSLKELDRANFIFFDHPWQEKVPDWLTIAAVWEKSGEPSLAPVGTTYPIQRFPGFQILDRDKPVIIADVEDETDESVDLELLSIFRNLGMRSVVAFPLRVGEQWFGIVSGQASTPFRLAGEEVRRVTNLVSQAATVLQNLRLLQETRKALEQADLFRQLVNAASQGVGLASLQGEILYVNPALATLYGISSDEILNKSFINLYPEESAEYMMQQVIPEAMKQGAWTGELELVSQASGQRIPTINNVFLIYDQQGAPQFMANVITDISDQRQQAKRLSIINESAQMLGSASDTTEVLKIACAQAQRLLDGQDVSIALLDPSGETVEILAFSGSEIIQTGKRLPVNGTAVGASILKNQILVLPDDASPAEFVDTSHLASQGIQTTLNAPMMIGSKVIGTLNLSSTKSGAFKEQEKYLMGQLIVLVTSAYENRRLLRQIRSQAQYEQRLRELTAQVRGLIDADAIMRTAVRQLGNAIGRKTFIHLESPTEKGAVPKQTGPLPDISNTSINNQQS